MHGYPDTAWTWRYLGPYLGAHGWRVVAPFMRGYAPTDLAPDGCYQVGALIRDAVGAHRALGGSADAVVIGHDWGAVAAYSTAAFAPGLFSRVVALAVPPLQTVFALLKRPLANLQLIARQLRMSWYILFQQLPAISERSLDWLIPKLWDKWSPGYDADEDIRHVLEALRSPAHRNAALRYYRALAQPWYRSREYAPEQRRLFELPSRPVLFLQGARDGCLQPEFLDRSRPALPPGSATALVEGAGHFLHLERPDVVNERIAVFLQAREP